MHDLFLHKVTCSVNSTTKYAFQAQRLLLRWLLQWRVRVLRLGIWGLLLHVGMLRLRRDRVVLRSGWMMLLPRCRHFPLTDKCHAHGQ